MTSPVQQTIHATSIAIGGRAILIMGASGSGKSDLALRLIDRGAALISDDYTVIAADGPILFASPPASIAGRIEIRHLGLIDMPHVSNVPIALAVRLEDSPERMPDSPASIDLCGHSVPLVALSGREPSAPIKTEIALRLHGHTGSRR